MTFGNDGFSKVIAYIDDHFDEFKLILTSGENSTYQEFIHRIIELDISCTMQFIEQEMTRFPPDGLRLNWRTFCPVFFVNAGLFEVVIHDMPLDQAVEHIQRMSKVYNAGWKTIFEENAGDAFEWVD